MVIQSRQPVGDDNETDNDNDNHAMFNYLEQNANNRLKALKSDRIMTLVSAAPVAKPNCVLDLRSTEIFQTSLKCSKKSNILRGFQIL